MYTLRMTVFEEPGSWLLSLTSFCLDYLSLENLTKCKGIWPNSSCWFLSSKPPPKCHSTCHVDLPCKGLWTLGYGPLADSWFSSWEMIRLWQPHKDEEHRKKSTFVEEMGMRGMALGMSSVRCLETLTEMFSRQSKIWGRALGSPCL